MRQNAANVGTAISGLRRKRAESSNLSAHWPFGFILKQLAGASSGRVPILMFSVSDIGTSFDLPVYL